MSMDSAAPVNACLARRSGSGYAPLRSWLRVLLFAACTTSTVTACGSKPQTGGAPETVPVNVAAVKQKDVPVQLRAIGNVEAYSTVAVKSQVDGELAQINFKEGQEVKEGDLLFMIDPRPYQAALQQAEATLVRNRTEANNAQVQAERFQRLVANNFISREAYDEVRTRAESLQATVKADQAAVENAKLQLQYCYIHAPITGRVGQYLVHVGNVIKSRDAPLVTINRIRPVYVAFSVPEQQLAEIRKRAATHELKVEAFLSSDGAPPPAGELSFIDNAVDMKSGTVLLKGLFPNADEMLWPGQFVTVALTLRTQAQALLVPAAAVQSGQQGQYVFVVGKDLTAQVRPVVTGMAVDDEVVIENGLGVGDTVVTRGHVRLAAGTKVEVKDGVNGAATHSAGGQE